MRWRVLAVVTLLALSGCSGLLGGDEPEPTVTPAPVPTDEPGSNPGSMLAPGIFADGELDTALLSEAHGDVLRNTSFVWTETDNRTGRIGNVTDSTVARRTVVMENRTNYYFDTNSRSDRYQGQRVFYPVYNEYADGEDVYVRALATSWVAYRFDRFDANGTHDRYIRSMTEAVDRYLAVESVRVERIESAAGPRYRLVGTDPTGVLALMAEDYRVVANVTPDGLVENLTATYTSERPSSSGTITFSHRYTSTLTDVGNTSVRQPEWLSTAKTRLANDTNPPLP